MNGQPALILDVSRTQGQVTAGLSETGATVQHYSSTEVNWAEISAISYSLIGLVEKSGQLGPLSAGAGADLKKSGRLLFEKILPVDIKRRLATASPVDLTLQIDEQLVFVPWEMLFDGEDFLCLRFNLGRCVKTRQPFARTSTRPPASPLRMLIIGDPKNDLPAAAREASRIRQELAEAKSIVVTSKTSNVLSRYVVRNIHGCDILHYAGHAEYDF
ncbi:MAG: CHAT domain-containing protein, partial [Candidatus Omnitrophica bacterium]|nr:CHAT domain-containing protein [Candidatus Omnitrophota bacterium]